MATLDDETRDRMLIDTARLAAVTAKAVQPLIASTQQEPGQFGGTVYPPTPRQIASDLGKQADALLARLPSDTDSRDTDQNKGKA